ncbi:talin-1-like isoform X14 [Branchiostoma lanceolatum]|uniref:talin-1-like isoform X14 n=1 Tax=Branchiostoma lanceolatum TaxID=7740 RepID=UPI00345268DA
MASLSLKISVKHANVVKTMQFEPSTIVYDACRMIRERIPEAQMGNATEFGMFLADEDPKKGVWLEAGRTLDYYLLRSGDLLEYKKKHRPLKVRMLDGTVKTVMVDDSHTVAQLLVTICTRIGITNHDEYSLVREGEKIREAAEPPTPVKKNYYGTMTRTMTRLSLDRTLQRDEKKMEALKKKLHTDDELNWLDHGRTLREQGIDDTETLLLRRKFFYSDQNVDSRDPVQLNLLYVQARDGILNGTHPVTVDEAMMFAAYQTQIQFGDHIETKHKSGFLDLKEFLPKEYVKNKGIEKKIWLEHRKLAGLSELDAKVRYTQQCRSLKTYGVTFFLVKEKMKGKNKLVPRLLGITKDSVMRVDEKTKEILKVWPLTTVRRWAASPKSFTLDFGDYSESYYSVQTTEGETISQLIAGYIDIILRKKKGKDRFGMDGEEESTMLEDSVSPARATIMQHQENKVGHVNEGSVAIPAVMRAHDGAESYSMGSMPRAEYATIRGQIHSAHMPPINTQAQQALMGNISSGFNSISAAQAELGSRAELPPLGSDPASLKWKQNTLDVSKQNVTSQLAAMSAATASVVTLTSDLKHQKIVDRFRGTPNNVKGEPEQTDFTAVGSAVTTISSNLTEMSKGIKMVAALLEDYGQGERLLDAARNLAGAFSDLLSAAKPGSTEREPEPRQNLLTAAGNIGEHGREVLHEMGEVDTDPRFQDALMALAKAVANATATLVLKAKNVASKAEDPAMQNKVIASATQTALSTSQLVACTKVVAPTISHPACQEQLIDAAKLVAKSVEKTVDSSQMATHDEFLLKDLGAAATQVTQALNDLLQHIKQASKAKGGEQYEDHCDTIISASDRLFASMGNASDMIKQAKILAEATSHLVNSIKTSADTTDDTDSQKRLLGAAKVLADATARMVEAAKGCAVNPHDSDEQENLRKAAEDLRAATNAAAGNAIKKKLVGKLETSEETVTVKTMTFTKVKLTHYDKDLLKKILEELQNAAKHAAAVATQTIAASQAASSSNKNPSSQQQLVSSCKHVADHIPRLVQGVRGSRAQPDSPSAQLLLINASQEFISPANNMNSAAKAAVPTVSDQAASMQLSNCSKQLAQALAELRSAAQKAQDACGPLEIDSALDTICQLDSDLVEIKKSAAQGQLVPLPDESGEQCAQELGHTSKTVGASMAQLLTAAAQGNENYTGLAARDTANALRTLTGAVRGVAAATSDRQAQDHLIDTARDVMDKSVNLIEEAKKAVNDPNNPDNQQRLAQVAKAVSHALNNCVNCLPGQRDVDFAIRNIGEASKALLSGQLQKGDVSFQEVQTMLSTAAQELNMASSELVVASKGTHEQLAQASGKFSKDFSLLLEAGMQMAAQTSDDEQQSLMVSNLKSISMSSSKLLLAAKSLSADPNAPNAKNQLASAARSVTDSINQLINICMQTAPGQKECDNALRNIEVMRSMLDNPMEPVNDLTYFDCLETVMDKSKTLGESMSSITQHAKNSEHEEFGSAVTRASTAVCGLTEAASQTAYLVGIADPSSQAGRQGLVDQSQFARANQAIQMACQQLLDPTTSQAQVRAGKTSTVTVLSAATVIAKHTSSLCNMCRVASTKTSNPVAKRHFVQSAKEVANSTANLVKSIKALDGNFTEQNRQQVAEASRPLMEAVENLTTFASNPEFASVPAQISIEARKAQEPIVIAGRTIIDSTSSLITTAKLLAVNPKDPPTWQLLAGHSKTVSDSIKRLIASIRDKAPGQRECDRGIQVINQCIRDVDQASLSAVTQKLEARNEGTTQIFQEQMNNAAHEIGKNVDGVASAAKEKAEKLGHQVTQLSSYFDPLASAAINLASKTMNSQKQANLLEQTKTVAESALQLVYTSKEGGGNPKATHAHAAIDEAAEGMKEAVDDLLKTLDESASETGAVFGMVDGITKAMSDMVDGRLEDKPDGTFVDYQTKMVKIAKQIARTSHDMVGKASSSPEELGPQANALSHDFSELAAQSKGAMATINSPELSDRIRNSVQDLGNSCVDVVNNAGAIQSNPTDTYAKKDLIENSRAVSEKVLFVLASLQAGSRGTQACINAASTVSGIIGDLDTTIMFASAGTLSPEMEDEAFADHRENILKTAKALVEDTKTLVSGAASSQEHLAAAAQSAVDTITKLADAVKSGAASLGPQDAEAQVLLINAVKDVAVALGELIEATKNASGKPVQDPSMVQLKNSAKVMVTNVTSLLKTVKTVEDEAARGTRALEATIEAIKQEMRILSSMDPPEKRLPPEDLIRSTKPVTLLTAKAVAAGTSCRQDDVIAVANMSRKSVGDLIVTCKASAFGAEQRETTERAMEVGRNTVSMYVELLMHVLSILQKPTHEGKQKLAHFSKRVATAVAELVQTAEAIKGSEWVDPEDPTVVAENELLGAASAIEAAAKKLSELKPRPKAKEVDETLNFEEQILEAAKSIAAATSALVKAASTAQRELVAQGKVGASRAMAYDDGQWSQGLISAARMVAAATGSLCEAANEMVQGLASEEKLISSAKQVAASTAQLLVACKVKADPDSEAMRRLQQAGNRVKHASEELVKAAQQAAAIEEEERNIELSKRRVPTIAMEIQAQEEILRKERALEEARKNLYKIRQAKYKNRPQQDQDSDD